MSTAPEFDLSGLIDMHIHSGPDSRPRYCDDVQAAREAKAAGLQAILIKSHITLTADRATIAESVVGDIRVFGGLVLNYAVGGLNPAAVEAALQMGAKEIWMPTKDAANERRRAGKTGGISIFSQTNKILDEVQEILDMTHQANAIFATGHLSVEEILALVNLARERGIRKFLVTHPDSPLIQMPIETQIGISGEGIFFERCYVDTTAAMNHATTVGEIADVIRKVGVDSTVVTTDFGLATLPPPVDGMREYLSGLARKGISSDEISTMTKEIPSYLLDL